MNKQPLKALAILAVLAGSLTVNAVYAAEVTDVLKAGAVKVKQLNPRKPKLIVLLIKPMVFCKNLNRSTSRSNHCESTILSLIVRSLARKL